jgi:hypothetical protein
VIEGYRIDIDKTDSTINAVTITRDGEPVVRFAMRSYSLVAEIPAKPKTETQHRLTGRVFDLDVDKTFASYEDAKLSMDKYRTDAGMHEVELTIETIAVEKPDPMVSYDDDLPF